MSLLKITIRVLIGFMLIGAVVGISMVLLYRSKEFNAAHSIAQQYAVQESLSTNLTCISANRSLTKQRGDYNLSCFVFLPKNEFNYANIINNYNSSHLIFVRYMDKCPLNVFEVGTTTNPDARNCLTNTAINVAYFVTPPVDHFSISN
jgi:hypothetical protein